MRKEFIRHDNLRKSLESLHESGGDFDKECVDSFIREIKHSNLIIAADIMPGCATFMFERIEGERYGLLFTDMDEFRKSFSPDESGSHYFDFRTYRQIIRKGLLDGFIINRESEGFIFSGELVQAISELPESDFPVDDVYSPAELKSLRDSIDNRELEEFIADSSNIGRYEELFEKMSSSTLLTMMLSREDLTSLADDGVISMDETGPLGFLYIDEIGGEYATVYTSEDRMRDVETGLNRYSQIVNFSQMARFIISDDMDGIIINPNSDNVLLTRDVLLEYSGLLERTCNNPKLNTSFYHMFIMEEA